jgi:short subunit dehydrogenase-like uncharacterized protein
MAEREFDVALLGASGFTGRLTAEYLARDAPQGLRLALAGRRPEALERLREDLRFPGEVGLVRADVEDPRSLHELAERSRVLITTVGPYLKYGEPAVAACARAGTDYVDLTGEPEFVDRMWLAHQAEAERSGARIVHSCGFDSIPYDLGVLFTVSRLPDDVPLRVSGYVRASGTFSGGTYHSAVGALARLRQAAQVHRRRRRGEGDAPPGRRVRSLLGTPHHDDAAGGWVLPFPSIDPDTVTRSARILSTYGPDFTYSHFIVAGRLPVAAGLAGGALGAVAMAQLPPTRALLLRLKAPGEGPSPEQRERAWFRVRFRAQAPGREIVTELSGGDPGYGETSKMLAESALCLALDELPARAGQLTPAVAMGQALIDRLQARGIAFRVLSDA